MCETVTSDVPAPGAASGRQPGLHTGHLAPLLPRDAVCALPGPGAAQGTGAELAPHPEGTHRAG